MNKKLFDPVANARSIGKLYLLTAIFEFFMFSSSILKGTLKNLELFNNIFSLILTITIGYGLIKTKKWALYVFFISIFIGIIRTLFDYISKGGVLINLSVISVVINIILVLWFFPARNRFKD